VSDLLSIEDALAAVLARVVPLEGEEVAVADAAGRVLAEPARAAVDLPPFPSSAMDGFAVRADDAPGELPVVARVAAGRPVGRALGAGEAIAISTGGVVPEGADAVVPIEKVEERGDRIRISAVVGNGDNIRERGGDVRAGDVVLAAGTRLGPAQVGALAASGLATVACARRPRAAVLATGTELRPPGAALAPGEIYESNTFTLAAQLAAAGADVDRLAGVEDDEAATRDALERGLAGDVLVTSGGVSVGPHDLVRRALADLGAEEVFWRVAVRPGKPVAFAVRGPTLVFGLPGNPVSSLVGFELFVRPALLALQGVPDPRPPFRPAQLGRSVRRTASRDTLLRGRSRVEDGALVVDPVVGQESHMIVRAAEADCLVLVSRGDGEVPEGATVDCLTL
jgi:molybdopterin molybdotransferase